MLIDYFWQFAAIGIALIMLLGNKKVRILSVLQKQFMIFKNAKTGRFSPWDFCCFVVFPIILAMILGYRLKVVIDEQLAQLLTTVFSLVFTVLFGFAAIIVGKIESPNGLEKQVASETFISVISATWLSLVAAILSILIMQIQNMVIVRMFSVCVYAISFITVMLLLMVTKRTYKIYCKSCK